MEDFVQSQSRDSEAGVSELRMHGLSSSRVRRVRDDQSELRKAQIQVNTTLCLFLLSFELHVDQKGAVGFRAFLTPQEATRTYTGSQERKKVGQEPLEVFAIFSQKKL